MGILLDYSCRSAAGDRQGHGPYKALKRPYKALKRPYKALKGPDKVTNDA